MAHVAGWGVVADMRKYLYDHLQRLSLRFYEDKQTGQLMSRVINDTDLFEQMIAHAVPDVFVNVITLIRGQRGFVQSKLASGLAQLDPNSTGDIGIADIFQVCSPGLQGTPERTGRAECSVE